MGYLVQNSMEVSIFIDDNEYPLEDTNLLNFLHISTTAAGFYPTLQLSITDNARIIDRIGLQDGIPIRVVIKNDRSDAQTYFFRKFHHSKSPSGPASTYIIDGYYDSPLWFNGATNTNIRGNADSILSTIASICNLQYDGSATNDSQLWTPQNKSYKQFAKETANNAYIDNTSCMCLALDLDGTLRFKNVNDLPDAQRKILAFDFSDDAATAVSFSNSATSGFNNAVGGYWNTRISQSLVSNETQDVIDQLEFKADSRAPLFNKTLKNDMVQGAVRFAPIDVGNLHANYERASYQNMRYRNLFSMGLDLLMNQQSTFQIFEKINFSVQREDTSQDTSSSGEYTISGRAIFVSGSNYAEKLQIIRHGTNENYVEG